MAYWDAIPIRSSLTTDLPLHSLLRPFASSLGKLELKMDLSLRSLMLRILID